MEIGSTIGSTGLMPYLPDEIISNILSRLSVKFVIRCRLVCKTWRDLTSNHDFVDLNFRVSLPLILSANFHDQGGDVYMLEKWWGPSRSRTIHRFRFHYRNLIPDLLNPLISQGGLLVYDNLQATAASFFIVNPIYPTEIVRITLPVVLRFSEIYGVFFHPLLKEYCSLWKIHIHYMMLTLGSNPSLKSVAVSNLLLERVKKPKTYPLLIGNYLCWMLESERNGLKRLNDIMKFDIMSEEFTVIHCPVPSNTDCSYNRTHLLDIDGILSYLLVLPCKFMIWRLKDHKEELWSEFSLNVEISHSNFHCGIAGVNGKLAFLWYHTLYICNLVKGTVKKYQKGVQRGLWIDLSHQLSLASLSNCKPAISIGQDKDNKVVVVVEENQ